MKRKYYLWTWKSRGMDEKKKCVEKKKEQTAQEHKEKLQENYELGVKYMEDLEEKEKR